MITLETGSEGFTLSVDGHGVFSHSVRRPCVELGETRRPRGGSRKTGTSLEKKVRFLPLRAYRIEESTPNSVVVDFEGRLRLSAKLSGSKLRLSFSRPGDRFERLRFRLAAVPGESIFGCGERYGPLNLKGSLVSLWVDDGGSGREFFTLSPAAGARPGSRGRRPTCLPLPSFVSTQRYWVHADSPAPARFDFRAARSTVLEFRQVPKEIAVGWAGSAAETAAGLSCHAGRPPAIPAWTRRGAVLGLGGGIAEVRRKLDIAREAGVPVAAVWVEDWCGRCASRHGIHAYFSWTADAELYPDLPAAIATLRAEGVRFLGHISPFLAADGSLYAEAHDRGFCVRTAEGADYLASVDAGTAALMDLTNPRAVRWIKDLIRGRMIDAGMSGWLADSGVCLPDDAVLHSGERPRDLHNLWPVLWARINREIIEEAGRADEIAVFLRSGWAGSSSLASGFWADARRADFSDANGISSLIPAGLSAGLSGAGFWHFDVGGSASRVFGSRKSECLKRWFEIGAFSPVFRTHEGGRPKADSQYWTDLCCLRHFARMTGIFAALEPYHAIVARECSEAGLAPVRHLWMHYEQDPQACLASHQYLYGRDLLVAPVFRKGQVLKEAWLPPDRWVHFWTSRTFRGGSVILEAPLGYPLVFYREESRFAPLFDSIRRTARKP